MHPKHIPHASARLYTINRTPYLSCKQPSKWQREVQPSVIATPPREVMTTNTLDLDAPVARDTEPSPTNVPRNDSLVNASQVLRIKSVTWEAPNILSYELTPLEGGELPPFTAGAHIDLVLPVGMTRSYSLVNSEIERHRYVIAVQKDRATRGGSEWIHKNLKAGDTVSVQGPRNHFALDEAAKKSIFIAAGIGITPILSMIERMKFLGRDWELTYCARTRESAAFLGLLQNDPRVRLNFDCEPGGKMLDIAALVRESPRDAHFYCCGPLPVLEAFESATEGLPSERVHLEYFAAKELPPAEGGFRVVLARSGREMTVSPGKSILDTLRESGLDVPYSCGQGVCGTCDTAVLEGIPDHRDFILTKNERASNKRMMICCSGAKSEKLVLDL